MENSLQTALKNLLEDHATDGDLNILRQGFSSGQIFIGGNVRNSVIIAGNGNTVQLTAEAIERLTVNEGNSSLHQLPQPPADFVGRVDELKNILASVKQAKGATISGITGMAGIGKTALGLISAHEMIKEYPDAQFFIDLKGSSKRPLKPFDVMKHIVQSIYPSENLKNINEANLAGKYQSALSNKKALVFLDNARSAKQIIPLLPPRSCCVLATSRWQFSVPGLQSLKLDILNKDESSKLLMDICPRISIDDAHKIASICGYLPIALRLAGGFLQSNVDWSPAEYILRLSKKNKKLDLLEVEESSISIKTVFSQSYKTLTKNERKYWSMLAVFPASFNRSAIATLWDLDDEAAHQIASKFCQYNLMEFDMISSRYHVHDLLIEYANSKLSKTDKEISRQNHLKHYRAEWFKAEELFKQGGENVSHGLNLFDSEYVHIETAYNWALKKKDAPIDILNIVKTIPDFVNIVPLRLHPSKHLEWFQMILNIAQRLDDRQSQNKLLGSLGAAFFNLGQYKKSIECYEQACEIAKSISEWNYYCNWLKSMGTAYGNFGDSRKMIFYNEQAFEIASKIGDIQTQGIAQGNIGAAYINLGENNKAIENCEKALEISRKTGDLQHQGKWLGNIGVAYIGLGENRKAIEYMKQAVEICQELGDRVGQNMWLGNIGAALSNLGEHHQAIESFEQALIIAKEIGDKQDQGMWLGNIGGAYIGLNDNHKAIEYSKQALDLSREMGDRQQESFWLGDLGVSHGNLNEYSIATEYVTQALAISIEIDDRLSQAVWLNQLGELNIKTNNLRTAKLNLEKALALSKELGIRDVEAKSLFNFAKLNQLEQDNNSAIIYAEEAHEIFKSLESPKLSEVDRFIKTLKQIP